MGRDLDNVYLFNIDARKYMRNMDQCTKILFNLLHGYCIYFENGYMLLWSKIFYFSNVDEIIYMYGIHHFFFLNVSES